MQAVEMYYDSYEAYKDMKDHISKGWRVHTCTMSTVKAGYESSTKVLVVYEKENK